MAEQRGGIRVHPLQIVDVSDERPSIADAWEELAQRVERTPPELRRSEAAAHGGVGDRCDAPEYREQLGEREDVARHECRSVGGAQATQVASQLVNQRIEGLERQALALVTTPLEHGGPALEAHFIEE